MHIPAKVKKILRILLFLVCCVAIYKCTESLYHKKDIIPRDVFFIRLFYLVILYGIFIGICSYYFITKKRIQDLLRHGVYTNAAVKEITEGYGNYKKFYFITAEYIANSGVTYTKRFNLLRKDYQSFCDNGYLKDDSFEVLYNPLKPEYCYMVFAIDDFVSIHTDKIGVR